MLEDKIDKTTNYATTEGEETTEDITRRVRISLEVFDPVRGKDVWRGEVSNHKTNTETVGGEGFNLGTALAEIAIAAAYYAIVGDSGEKEPPPVFDSTPELADIAWGLYGELGKRLATPQEQ